MQVRPVTDQDQDAWLRMRRALYPEVADPNQLVEMENHLRDPARGACFLAYLDEKPVGFIEVAVRDWAEGCTTHNVGYLESVYVDEFFRRSGVAKALIGAAEIWARDHGAKEIASDVDINNEESLGLHHHMDYTEVGRSALFKKDLV